MMRTFVLLLSLTASLASLAEAPSPSVSSKASSSLNEAAPGADDVVAPPPAPAVASSPLLASVEALLQKDLVRPLAAKEEERSKFSRARMPPRERRVRVLETAHTDAKGAAFLTFAIDERHGFSETATWRADAVVGCVYPKDGRIFVKAGDTFRPGATLMGKKAKSAGADVCVDVDNAANG